MQEKENILVINMSSPDRFLNSKPALGALYIYSSLKEHFKAKTNIDFVNLATDTDFNLESYIEEKNPPVIVFSINESYLSDVMYELLMRIKKINPGIITVAGGVHSSLLPKETVKYADLVVHGEGQDTIIKLVSLIRIKSVTGNVKDKLSISGINEVSGINGITNIKGIWYKDSSGTPCFTGYADLPDPNALPPLPLEDINLSNYDFCSDNFNGEPSFQLVSSFGCPNRCFFCSYHSINPSRNIRYRRVEKVLNDIEMIMEKWGVFNFEFYDDCFMTDPKRVERFCRDIIKRKLPVKWRCMTRADSVKQELPELMYLAGARKISIGLESGDQKVLDATNKNITLEQNARACRFIKDSGITAEFYAMVGLPQQDMESIKTTITFFKETQPDNVSSEIFMPFPGSVFSKNPEKFGIKIIDKDFSHYKNVERSKSEKIFPVSETKWLSSNQILSARRMLANAFSRIRLLGKNNNQTPVELWDSGAFGKYLVKIVDCSSSFECCSPVLKMRELDSNNSGNVLVTGCDFICVTEKSGKSVEKIGKEIFRNGRKRIRGSCCDTSRIALLVEGKGTPHEREIYVFDMKGKIVMHVPPRQLEPATRIRFGSDQHFFGGIADICLKNNKVYVSFYLPGPMSFLEDSMKRLKNKPGILVFDLDSSDPSVSLKKIENPHIKHPNHIYTGRNRIYVADGEDIGAVKVFSCSGEFVRILEGSESKRIEHVLIAGYDGVGKGNGIGKNSGVGSSAENDRCGIIAVSKPFEGIYIYEGEDSSPGIIPAEILSVDVVSGLTMNGNRICYCGKNGFSYVITLGSSGACKALNKKRRPLAEFLSSLCGGKLRTKFDDKYMLILINKEEYLKIRDFLIDSGTSYEDANMLSDGENLFLKVSGNILKTKKFLKDLMSSLK